MLSMIVEFRFLEVIIYIHQMTMLTNSCSFCSLHIKLYLFFAYKNMRHQVHWQKSVHLLLLFYFECINQ